MLDLRQKKDGLITEPNDLLNEVGFTWRAIQQHMKHGSSEDITCLYGGLTPVPLTFLTGVTFDDESKFVVMDWDRFLERWRSLDDKDNGQRFDLEGFNQIDNAKEVVLAISASYYVRPENIQSTFDLPVTRLTLPDLNSSHWSLEKQNALAEQFYNASKLLEAKGVTTIHLLLAAQNSLAFSLGRHYDKKNLPSIIVYQYDAGSDKKFPWGVRMPVRGKTQPSVTWT